MAKADGGTAADGNEALWRAVLTGTHPGWVRGRGIHRLLPSSPRCKFCAAPFGAPGTLLMRLWGRGRSAYHPRMCDFCERFATQHPGGAEVEISMLFADVRGSTALAEQLRPAAFSQVLKRFYAVATEVLGQTDAIVDKLVGDEVIGLFLPALVGRGHARAAVDAAQALLRATGHADPEGPWLPVGAGVHTGTVYYGTVRAGVGAPDITVLGDAVNTTARLAALAGPGEVLLSETTYAAACTAGGERDGRAGPAALEQRRLTLRGRSEPVDVRVLHVGLPRGNTERQAVG
jgi:adenylate cyclase